MNGLRLQVFVNMFLLALILGEIAFGIARIENAVEKATLVQVKSQALLVEINTNLTRLNERTP